jgi:hypothetical protein
MILKNKLKATFIITSLTLSSVSLATPVNTGEFTLDFDEAILLNLPPEIRNSAWFDKASSANKTDNDMLSFQNAPAIPDMFIFDVFGNDLPAAGLTGRNPVASTFDYNVTPSSGTGKIGLAGVHRLTGTTGTIVAGDYDLSYDVTKGGWLLTNHLSFDAEVFNLPNVITSTLVANQFSLKGDVILTAALASMLSSPAGTKVGTFTFTTGKLGDATGEGSVDITDVVSIINTTLGTTSATEIGADCNVDGAVNIQDVVCSINKVLGN